jgi:hypothetical protein
VRRGDAETVVEAGLVLLAGGLIAGAALLLAGRVRGDAVRAGRHAEGPPARGAVPVERHQHISAVSAR